jgi:hypothetical protein
MPSDSLLPYFQDPLWAVLLRLAINVTALYIIIFLIYSRYTKSKENMFPFFLMGIMIFLICNLLKKVEMHMGMALGLFAVFSIMRFRTENLLTKNMAYLFTVIGLSVINAMFEFPHPVRGTIMINVVIILAVFLLEIALSRYSKDIESKADKKARKKAQKKEGGDDKIYVRHRVLYDNLDLLNQNSVADLISDLSKRTGIDIEKVKIRKIDLINRNADIEVFYKDKSAKEEE